MTALESTQHNRLIKESALEMSASESIQKHLTEPQPRGTMDTALQTLSLAVLVGSQRNAAGMDASGTVNMDGWYFNPVDAMLESMQTLQAHAMSLPPLRQLQLVSNIISWSVRARHRAPGDALPLYHAIDQANANGWAVHSRVVQLASAAVARHEALRVRIAEAERCHERRQDHQAPAPARHAKRGLSPSIAMARALTRLATTSPAGVNANNSAEGGAGARMEVSPAADPSSKRQRAR